MKLGLLVVLAVAAVLPSPSDSEIISKCELKEKLERAITLPKHLERYQENILATVICELNRRSGLNSGLVNVYGTRRTTTTARPTTRVTTLSSQATNKPTTPISLTTKSTMSQPTTTTLTSTTSTATAASTPRNNRPTTNVATITGPTTNTSTTNDTTITRPTTNTSTTNETLTTTTNTSTATLGVRRKRAVHTNSKECDMMDRSLVEMLKHEKNMFDEKELEMDNYRMRGEDKDSDEKDGRRNDQRQPWSLGLYGLFQLSDGHFCDSGYRWSRNVCRTDCRAFTDDEITDDVACVVKTRYWWYLLKNASRSCFHTWNFFSECE